MDWFRHYHGLCSDEKLTAAALTAGVHHCIAVAAWCYVLEQASQAEDRGSVAGVNPKHMAIALRLEIVQAQAILAAFAEEALVVDGRVKAWDKRQRRSDSSVERVRAWRDRKAAAPHGNGNAAATSRDGDVTLRPASGNVTNGARTEQNRSESDSLSPAAESHDPRARGEQQQHHPPPGVDSVPEDTIRELAGRLADLGGTLKQVQRQVAALVQLAGGAGPVTVAIETALRRARGDPLAYARRIVANHATQRAAAIEAAKAQATAPPDDWIAEASRRFNAALAEMDRTDDDLAPADRRLAH